MLADQMRQQTVGRNWCAGHDVLMMARIALATERTMVLERRIDAEFALTDAERSAAQKKHAAAAKRRPRPRAPQTGAGLLPGPIAPGMLSTVVAVLSAALGANEGDAQGTEALDAAADSDAHLPPRTSPRSASRPKSADARWPTSPRRPAA